MIPVPVRITRRGVVVALAVASPNATLADLAALHPTAVARLAFRIHLTKDTP